MKRLALTLAMAGILIAAMFSAVPPAAAIACDDFTYQVDADTILDGLGSDPYGIVDRRGDACGAEQGADESEDHNLQLPDQDYLPRGATEMEVQAAPDSETMIELKQNVFFGRDKNFIVNLIHVVSPMWGSASAARQCYGEESQRALRSTVSKGTNVWLVWDQRTEDGQVDGEIWIKNDEDRYQLVNVSLVQQGAAVVAIQTPNAGYGGNYHDAQDEAIADEAGLWGACAGREADDPIPSHSSASSDQPSTSASVAPSEAVGDDPFCSEFDSQSEAQEFFDDASDLPGVDVSSLDSDGDGIACESLS